MCTYVCISGVKQDDAPKSCAGFYAQSVACLLASLGIFIEVKWQVQTIM